MTTLRDVADIVGVHPSTVSRALDPASANLVSEKTRARVQAVADELGFQPDAVASGLRRGRSQTLGVVVPDLGNPYAAPMIRGIENSLESRGYLAFITETQDEHARARRIFEHLLSRRVDAIICLSARAGDAAILRRAARKVPVVLAVRDLPESGLPGVVGDDERGGRLAADHLLTQGHRAVAQLRGPESIHTFLLRGTGFSSRIREEGLAPIEIDAFAQAPTVDEGHAVMTRLLATHGPRPRRCSRTTTSSPSARLWRSGRPGWTARATSRSSATTTRPSRSSLIRRSPRSPCRSTRSAGSPPRSRCP